jgi:catechol 2,3-dioxygenase-like lactoylglutathione lyase family enzyme
VVLFCDDVERAAAFYARLGFTEASGCSRKALASTSRAYRGLVDAASPA